jgi:2-polyprenyl-3-methyl-5-hydroxy-6-metoxy-1,4-benzoquinol methylase
MNITIPLTFQQIVDEIVQFTDIPRQEVEHRVWMEAIDRGWNVQQDITLFQVTPHYYNKKMEQLYRESYGFVFESLVFWAKPNRQGWAESAVKRLKLYAKDRNLSHEKLKILMLGDGTGNDSLYLVKNGFKVDYYDVPGSRTFDFAMKRFDFYGLLGSINPLTDYNSCGGQYDAIASFEVLEHLTDPFAAIRDIYSWLKIGGIALITEAFARVDNIHPTHLAANAKYDGTTPFMFFKHGMLLSWYNRKYWFKPMEFVKLEKSSLLSANKLLKDPVVRGKYLSAIGREMKQMFLQQFQQ